jgi:hypothetical protein
MANTPITPNNAPGLFKTVYADIAKVLPEDAVLQDEVNFSEDDATGEKLVFMIPLTYCHSFSYAPSSGANTTITMNDAVPPYIGKAEVEGYQLIGRIQMDYAYLSKAASKGKRAFQAAMDASMESLVESARRRIEISLLHGQQGLGKLTSNTTGALVITAATWSAGLWVGMKDAVLTAWSAQTATATQHDGDLTVSGVTPSSRTVTVTGTSTSVVTNDHLYFKGSRTSTAYNEGAGLMKIANNTGSLFTIDASVYDSWGSVQKAVTGPIGFTVILSGQADAQVKGLREDSLLLVSPKRFAELNTDMAADRVFDSSYSSTKGEMGVSEIVYHSPAGSIRVKGHSLMKDGEAVSFPPSKCLRVGSSDLTFELPGTNGEMLLHIPDKNVYEARCYSDQVFFCKTPGRIVNFTGIVDPA